MLEIINLYLAPLKAWIFASIIVIVSGYIVYLNWSLLAYERENKTLKEQYIQCEQDRLSLRAEVEYKEKALEILTDYYKKRKPFDDSKGPLRPDEILD